MSYDKHTTLGDIFQDIRSYPVLETWIGVASPECRFVVLTGPNQTAYYYGYDLSYYEALDKAIARFRIESERSR